MIPHECPECEEPCSCVVGDVDMDACEHDCGDWEEEDEDEEEDGYDDGSGFFDDDDDEEE